MNKNPPSHSEACPHPYIHTSGSPGRPGGPPGSDRRGGDAERAAAGGERGAEGRGADAGAGEAEGETLPRQRQRAQRLVLVRVPSALISNSVYRYRWQQCVLTVSVPDP